LRGDESGLVAARTAAEDGDIGTRQGHVKQLSRTSPPGCTSARTITLYA
jgi:hypothetical protein